MLHLKGVCGLKKGLRTPDLNCKGTNEWHGVSKGGDHMHVEVISVWWCEANNPLFKCWVRITGLTKPLQVPTKMMDPALPFENHGPGLQELADIQQSLHNHLSFSNFKHEHLNRSNKQIVGLNLLHGHFWHVSPLSDSSWTLHRANSGTACTKTWPRSEASPYINPDGIGFPRHLLTAFTHKAQSLCSSSSL